MSRVWTGIALCASLGWGAVAWAGDHHGHHAKTAEPEATETPDAPSDDATVHHRFDDVDRWVKAFDDPARDAWQKPAELVAALAIAPGSTVADIGAGTGYFNRYLSAAVGPEGHVIAVDIEPALVAHMAERAAAEGTPNVEPRLGQPSDPGLTAGEVYRVLLVNTYHHIDDRVAYFTRLREAVKPGGWLFVVDFLPGDLPIGPPPEHRVSYQQVTAELHEAGWQVAKEPITLPYQFVGAFYAE